MIEIEDEGFTYDHRGVDGPGSSSQYRIPASTLRIEDPLCHIEL